MADDLLNWTIINVSLQEGADASALEAAKKKITDQGGLIHKEYKLIKAFTGAEVHKDQVSVLAEEEGVIVEVDGDWKVHT